MYAGTVLFLVQLIGNVQWCIKLLLGGEGWWLRSPCPAKVCDGIHVGLFIYSPYRQKTKIIRFYYKKISAYSNPKIYS